MNDQNHYASEAIKVLTQFKGSAPQAVQSRVQEVIDFCERAKTMTQGDINNEITLLQTHAVYSQENATAICKNGMALMARYDGKEKWADQ